MVDIPIFFRDNKFNNKVFNKWKSFDDKMHPRNPMFQMPQWMSEDDDMTFPSRVNQRWGFGRGGPWGERQCDPEFDRSDQGATTIPIRIEAEAPPGWVPEQAPSQEPVQKSSEDQVDSSNSLPEGINPEMRVGKQPTYASKTTSDVTNCTQEEVPRDARSSSAPPKMKEDQPQTFVSKMNITPQQPPNPKIQKFNNIAKPFGASEEQNRIEEVNEPSPEPVNQTQNQGAEQKAGFVRNIPIVYEGGEEQDTRPARQTPPTQNQQLPHQEPGWHQQYGGNAGRFPSDMFDDPFFNFGGFGSPRMQRHAQQPHPQQTHPHHQQAHPHQQQSHPQQHQPPLQQQKPHPQQQEFQQRPTKMNENASTEQKMEQSPHKAQQQPVINKNSTRPTEIPVNVQKTAESRPKSTEPVKKEPPKDFKMEKINSVKKSVDEYKKQVEAFSGSSKNKDYLYIDEMLTRQLLELDNIDPDGRDDIRQSRRALVKDINATINSLDQKLKSQQPLRPMDTDKPVNSIDNKEVSNEKETNAQVEKMEVDNEAEKENKEKSVSKPNESVPTSDPIPSDSKESKVDVEEQIETKENLCSS